MSESPCIKPDCLDQNGICDIWHCPENPARLKEKAEAQTESQGNDLLDVVCHIPLQPISGMA
jgi:hypothetical protein